MAIGDQIARLREARGWKRPELARLMGTSTQQIERLEKGQRKVNEDWIARAAAALEVEPSQLMTDDPAPIAPTQNAQPFKYDAPSFERMAENLPIYGSALGSEKYVDGEAIEQTMLNSGDVVGYLKRPVILNGRTDVYGLWVQGHSMDPVFCAGSTIIAEMKRPPRIGDDVVVYLRPDGHEDDGERARAVLVKRLVKRSASFVELQQYSPGITFRLDMAEILRIDRIMTLGDLLS